MLRGTHLTLLIYFSKQQRKGDRIAIGHATDNAAGTGSPQWTVTDLTL
ncbi:MAG: hypothetical protein ACI8RD_008120 [Bacillariaceae sp.]|jgi:hypothetical protein